MFGAGAEAAEWRALWAKRWRQHTETDPALEAAALLGIDHARTPMCVLLRVGQRGLYLDQWVDLDHRELTDERGRRRCAPERPLKRSFGREHGGVGTGKSKCDFSPCLS